MLEAPPWMRQLLQPMPGLQKPPPCQARHAGTAAATAGLALLPVGCYLARMPPPSWQPLSGQQHNSIENSNKANCNKATKCTPVFSGDIYFQAAACNLQHMHWRASICRILFPVCPEQHRKHPFQHALSKSLYRPSSHLKTNCSTPLLPLLEEWAYSLAWAHLRTGDVRHARLCLR